MSDDGPGTVLAGKYELVELLGDGGMAKVWRGVNRGSDGFTLPVAIKRLHPRIRDDAEMVRLFVEEARVGSHLRHPNIVAVHDFGTDADGDHYLVTELVDGLHFGNYLGAFKKLRKRAPWQICAAVAIDVLRALDVAHGTVDAYGNPSPIVHRDVTPENILLDVGGAVKLTDFGMARAMDRGRMTQPDVVKGKLSYLAPELVQGADPSPLTDLFSLGIVMWEALSGRRLFDAPTDFEVVQKLNDPKIPLLDVLCPDLPVGLTMAVHRALAIDPRGRFQTARDMLAALQTCVSSVTEPVDGYTLSRSFSAARERVSPVRKVKIDYA